MDQVGAALAYAVPGVCLALVTCYALFDLLTNREGGELVSEGAHHCDQAWRSAADTPATVCHWTSRGSVVGTLGHQLATFSVGEQVEQRIAGHQLSLIH